MLEGRQLKALDVTDHLECHRRLVLFASRELADGRRKSPGFDL